MVYVSGRIRRRQARRHKTRTRSARWIFGRQRPPMTPRPRRACRASEDSSARRCGTSKSQSAACPGSSCFSLPTAALRSLTAACQRLWQVIARTVPDRLGNQRMHLHACPRPGLRRSCRADQPGRRQSGQPVLCPGHAPAHVVPAPRGPAAAAAPGRRWQSTTRPAAAAGPARLPEPAAHPATAPRSR